MIGLNLTLITIILLLLFFSYSTYNYVVFLSLFIVLLLLFFVLTFNKSGSSNISKNVYFHQFYTFYNSYLTSKLSENQDKKLTALIRLIFISRGKK